jgi:hypothetical protein
LAAHTFGLDLHVLNASTESDFEAVFAPKPFGLLRPRREWPSGRCASSSVMNSRRSFDHFVGAGEQRQRHVEAERSGGSSVHWRKKIDYAFLFLKPRLLIVAGFL